MTDQGFEILEHTADLRIKAWGKTKEELFKNALRGMAYVQKEEARIKNQEARITKKVQVKSTDMTALLIDFLSEVLTQSQINRVVFFDANFKAFSDTPSADSGQVELEAEIEGIKVDKFDEDIKAVTYHEAEVKQNPEGVYETKIVFDI